MMMMTMMNDDATSVSEILSNDGAVDDTVVAELLDLIATQTVVIEELREQNDALQKRIAELQVWRHNATSTTARSNANCQPNGVGAELETACANGQT
jgi:uncharacterized coiled-coil protein SlyX